MLKTSGWLGPWALLICSIIGHVYPVEYALRTEPQAVEATTFQGRPVLTVHWGAVGGAIDRSGDDILAERERLLDVARSPAALAWCMDQYGVTSAQDTAAGRRRGAEAMLLYRSAPQQAGLPAVAAASVRHLPVPDFLRLPRDVLGVLSVAMIDAADPRQRRWAEGLRRDHPQVQLFVLGWESLQAVDVWMDAAPVVAGAHVLSRVEQADVVLEPADFAQRYQVHQLPVHITFPDGRTMQIHEGLDAVVIPAAAATGDSHD